MHKPASLAAYEPFHKESLHCLAVDAAAAAVFLVGALFIRSRGFGGRALWLGAGAVLLVYLIGETLLNHRLSILARLETHFGWFETASLQQESIAEKFSLSGRWGSVMPRLYPGELHAGRYRVKMTAPTGERVTLRCAVCGRQWRQTPPPEGRFISVVYGRYSHIILSWEGVHLRKVSGLFERENIKGPTVTI